MPRPGSQCVGADGWTITDDPLTLSYGGRDVYVDLGAERTTLAAEKEGHKIAVEIKSFLSRSPVSDLEDAIGQYHIYLDLLAEAQSERTLYLAVPKRAYEGIFSEPFGQLILRHQKLRLLVFSEKEERIVTWIP